MLSWLESVIYPDLMVTQYTKLFKILSSGCVLNSHLKHFLVLSFYFSKIPT